MREMPLSFHKKIITKCIPLVSDLGIYLLVERFHYGFQAMFIVFPWCSDHIEISEYLFLLKKMEGTPLAFYKKDQY